MVMITVNIFEAKARLSEFVEAAARGERVVICNRNRPVAELRPIAQAPSARRLGTASGAVWMADDFNDALPDDLLDAFEGGPARHGATTVVESKGRSDAPKRKGRR